MDEGTRKVFFEIHQGLPREGPGDPESTRKAFSMLAGLPEDALILDVGCGPGMQTMDLTGLTRGSIVAVDNHQPFLDELNRRAKQNRVADRITTVNADMSCLEFNEGTFDLIWSEGAAYIMGFENALVGWKPLLKSPGYLAATEIAWIKPNRPEELESYFAGEYPAIQDVEANLATVRRAGYDVISHFVLPESAWWRHYYTPLERKLDAMRATYRADPKSLAVVELHEQEIDLYRKYCDYYGYVFFVMKSHQGLGSE